MFKPAGTGLFMYGQVHTLAQKSRRRPAFGLASSGSPDRGGRAGVMKLVVGTSSGRTTRHALSRFQTTSRRDGTARTTGDRPHPTNRRGYSRPDRFGLCGRAESGVCERLAYCVGNMGRNYALHSMLSSRSGCLEVER